MVTLLAFLAFAWLAWTDYRDTGAIPRRLAVPQNPLIPRVFAFGTTGAIRVFVASRAGPETRPDSVFDNLTRHVGKARALPRGPRETCTVGPGRGLRLDGG